MIFEGLTPERYESLVKTVQGQGLAIIGASGYSSYQGMDFTWSYDEAGGKLTIQCTNKPFFIPCSMIEERIRAAVK